MIESKKQVILKAKIEDIWDIITNNKDYSWRSDISRIELLDQGEKFIEYTNDAFPTTFYITRKEQPNRYEFDLENENMKGHWIGDLEEIGDSKTCVRLIEQIELQKKMPNLLVKIFLKHQQKQYMIDLKKKLQKIKLKL